MVELGFELLSTESRLQSPVAVHNTTDTGTVWHLHGAYTLILE